MCFLALAFSRVSGCSSFATGNTYTPARLKALFNLSVVIVLSHSYLFQDSLQNFCRLWVVSPTRHLVRDLIEPFLLVVAIHLVHVNANLFLSRKIDQLRYILSVFGS